MPTARWRRAVLPRLALYGTAIFVGLPFAFSQALVAGARQPTSPAPPGYEATALQADGLRLRALLARGKPERAAVVLVHGLGDTLDGYLDRADVLRRRGHSVLLLDLRAHGGSEGSRTTLGGREREDVRAALDLLRDQGLAGRGTVLVGHSMGAVAALRAAVSRPDVRAVVAEAPFDTYRENVYRHARLIYRMPRWVPLIPITIAVAEWRAGFRADDVDAVAASAAFAGPLYAIADGADERMPEAVVRRVFDAHRGEKRFWVAPGAEHVGAVLVPGYWPRMLSFLDDVGA